MVALLMPKSTRLLGLTLLAGISYRFWAIPLYEIQVRQYGLVTKLQTQGVKSLTFREKAAIYQANLLMGVVGYGLGLREVATETLLLAVPGPSERHWKSDFAMNSALVTQPIQAFVNRLDTYPNSVLVVKSSPIRIVFPASHFTTAPRVSLALNVFTLHLKATRSQKGWKINCTGTVPIKYSYGVRTRLFYYRDKSFVVDESLFWALQELDWLHPYTARWSWDLEVKNYPVVTPTVLQPLAPFHLPGFLLTPP